MRFLHHKQHTTEENHFWISISDLMTTLLFVFILILAVTILDLRTNKVVPEADYIQVKKERDIALAENIKLKKLIESLSLEKELFQNKMNKAIKEKQVIELKYNQLKEKIKKLLNKNRKARVELLHTLQRHLALQNVKVEIVPEEGVMRITKERLFDPSKAEVKDKKLIEAVTNELLTLLQDPKYRDAIQTIYIEGHTDSDPLYIERCGIVWTNRELSTQRAINTFMLMKKYAQKQNLPFEDKLFSYSGYADSRPIKGTTNKDKEEKARNRRIQFFFSLNPPKYKMVEDIE